MAAMREDEQFSFQREIENIFTSDYNVITENVTPVNRDNKSMKGKKKQRRAFQIFYWQY